jgi:hypothetical protein
MSRNRSDFKAFCKSLRDACQSSGLGAAGGAFGGAEGAFGGAGGAFGGMPPGAVGGWGIEARLSEAGGDLDRSAPQPVHTSTPGSFIFMHFGQTLLPFFAVGGLKHMGFYFLSIKYSV